MQDLDERLFEAKLEGLQPSLGQVAPEYAVMAFLQHRGDHLQEAKNPAAYLAGTLPPWWAENHTWVRDEYDEDYPSAEGLAAAEDQHRIAQETTAQERALQEADHQRLAFLNHQRDLMARQVAHLTHQFDEGYGDIYDFAQLLADGYSAEQVEADLVASRAKVRADGDADPFLWRESSGGEEGLRQRLGETSPPVDSGHSEHGESAACLNAADR